MHVHNTHTHTHIPAIINEFEDMNLKGIQEGYEGGGGRMK
jgi:hypothetical protein